MPHIAEGNTQLKLEMTFNSEEVNLLVYRYMLESGYQHSAYTFSHETNIVNSVNINMSVPRGALLSLLQKAVLFVEAEIFSLITEGDLDARFEKAVGSMSLLECSLCEAQKIKIFKKNSMDGSDDTPPSDQLFSGYLHIPGTSSSNNADQTDLLNNVSTSAPMLDIEIDTECKARNSMPSPTRRTAITPQISSNADLSIHINHDTGYENTSNQSNRHQLQRDRELRAQQTSNNSLTRCTYKPSTHIELIPQAGTTASSSGLNTPDSNSENINVHRKCIDSMHIAVPSSTGSVNNLKSTIDHHHHANMFKNNNGFPSIADSSSLASIQHSSRSSPHSFLQINDTAKVSASNQESSDIRTSSHYTLVETNGLVAQRYMAGKSSGS